MNFMTLARVTVITVAFVVGLTVGIFLLKPAHAASTIQYAVVPTHTGAATQAQLQTILNQQGSQGWELIMKYGTPDGDVLVFKK
jgi:hypothetical protein